MFQYLKKLFNRTPQQDPMVAQRERLLAIKMKETIESVRHVNMHKANVNALIHAVKPAHNDDQPGTVKRAKNAPVVETWLRAEPNTFPERTPMLYRIFMLTADEKGRAGYEHIVMVSNNMLDKDDVALLFAAWDAEGVRIANLPPEPDDKKPEAAKPAEKPPAPPAP